MAIDRNFLVDTDGTFADFTANGEMKVSNATLDGAKDGITGSIGTIEVEHHEIHEGEHFFINNYISVGNAGVLNHTFLTGDKDVHMTFEISGADAGFILQSYEAATGDDNGTTITPLNNKRNSLNTSTVTMRENPTNTAIVGATLIRQTRVGAGGAVSTRVAGSIGRMNEVIWKQNTKYLIRITNLSTSANNIDYSYSWYEE